MDGQNCVLKLEKPPLLGFPWLPQQLRARRLWQPCPLLSQLPLPCVIRRRNGKDFPSGAAWGRRGPVKANPSVNKLSPCEPGRGSRNGGVAWTCVPVFQEHACEEEGCDEWFYSWGLGMGTPFRNLSEVLFPNLQSVELSMGGDGTAAPFRAEVFG